MPNSTLLTNCLNDLENARKDYANTIREREMLDEKIARLEQIINSLDTLLDIESTDNNKEERITK